MWTRSVAVCILLAAAPGYRPAAGSADPVDRYRTQRLSWTGCDPAEPRLECATFQAPRDWRRPGAGPDVTLAVSRLATAGPHRRGILILDGGGPSSNLDLPLDYAGTPLAGGYDLIGYDPRGIGRSSRIHCLTAAELTDYLRVDARDRSAANVARIQRNARATAQACTSRSGDLLRYVGTEQIAGDLDLIRALLGEPRTNFLGFSAGSWFGAYYATLFPDRVGRFVLDSNTEFTATMQTVVDNQPAAFQRRFDRDFLPWLARHDATYHYGGTPARVRDRWEARRAALRREPLRLPGTTTLGPADLDNVTAALLYHQDDFPLLAQVLSIVDRFGTATGAERALLADLFNGPPGDPDVLAMYLAITCNDTPWTRDPAYWVRHSGAVGRRYPLQGYQLLFQPCAYWPFRPQRPPHITGAGVPPVLMVNSVHDPATPYEGAVRAHRGFAGSRLLTVRGSGDHVNYGRGNACVDGVVERFLLTGTLPRADASCPGQPLP